MDRDLFAVFLGAVMCLMSGAANADDGPKREDARLARGHQIAMSVCSACHAVPSARSPILREQAPALRSIANKPGTTPASLAAFLRSPSHRMPNPQLTDEMIDAVVGYTVIIGEYSSAAGGAILCVGTSRRQARAGHYQAWVG